MTCKVNYDTIIFDARAHVDLITEAFCKRFYRLEKVFFTRYPLPEHRGHMIGEIQEDLRLITVRLGWTGPDPCDHQEAHPQGIHPG